jgi:hypothetical protein
MALIIYQAIVKGYVFPICGSHIVSISYGRIRKLNCERMGAAPCLWNNIIVRRSPACR